MIFNHNVTLEEYETNTLYSVASVQILRALIHYKWQKIVLSQQKIHDVDDHDVCSSMIYYLQVLIFVSSSMF